LVGAVVALMDAGYRAERVSGTFAGSIAGTIVAAASRNGQMAGGEVKEPGAGRGLP
jgi:NTE family protein